jgi:hypothetical protein
MPQYILITEGESDGGILPSLCTVELSAENICDIRGALRHAKECGSAHRAEVFEETYQKIMGVPIPSFDY